MNVKFMDDYTMRFLLSTHTMCVLSYEPNILEWLYQPKIYIIKCNVDQNLISFLVHKLQNQISAFQFLCDKALLFTTVYHITIHNNHVTCRKKPQQLSYSNKSF